MKIVKFVDIPEQEVIIDISGQEAVEAICDESMTETKSLILMACSNFASFIQAVPAYMIAELTEKQRALICDFLKEQFDRFSPAKQQGETVIAGRDPAESEPRSRNL